VVSLYLLPLVVTNCWLVLYTLLHHTHEETKYYRGNSWNWLKGALSTVDRNYGLFNILHHRIGSTHVCDHLFSNIPHYYAEDAAKAIKPILGAYYSKDESPKLKTVFQVEHKCRSVYETAKGVYIYKS